MCITAISLLIIGVLSVQEAEGTSSDADANKGLAMSLVIWSGMDRLLFSLSMDSDRCMLAH